MPERAGVCLSEMPGHRLGGGDLLFPGPHPLFFCFLSERNSQHRAWTLLDDAVGCGTKDGQVQSIAAAHSQDDEVRMRFTGGADNLLVGLADSQTGLKEIGFPGGGRQQALELLYHLGRDRGEILCAAGNPP